MAAGGGLVVSLGLNAAEFVAGLTKAQYQAQKTFGDIEKSIHGITSGFETLAATVGIGLGISELVNFTKEVVNSAEELQHLSDETGSSIEDLSRLSNVAQITGLSFEQFHRNLDRLAAGLNGSEELSTKTAQALRQLGITSKDPAVALQQLAETLDKYADGSAKAAAARDIHGRGGVAFLPTLKAIAELTDVTATKTKEQVVQAEELARVYRRLNVESHGLADAFLNDIAPALEKIGRLLVIATVQSKGFFSGLVQAANINPFGDIDAQIDKVQEDIERVKAKIEKGKDVKFQFTIGQTDEEFLKSLNDRLAILQTFKKKSEDLAKPKEDKPPLPYKPITDNKDAENAAKKFLEGQLKAQDQAIQEQRDLLSTQKSFLQEYYQQNLITVDQFYDAQSAAEQEASAQIIQDYQNKIDAAKEYARTATTLAKRQEGENLVAENLEKQRKAVIDSVNAEKLLELQRTQAARKYLDELAQIDAAVLEVQGSTARAAGIKFDVANRGLSQQAALSGNADLQRQLEFLRQQEVAQAGLNDVTKIYDNLLGQIAVQQGYINLAQTTGRISEIEALQKQSDLNKAMIPYLEKIAEAYERIAASSADPNAVLKAQQMRLAIEQLRTQTDLLADSFNKTFGDAFSSALVDLVTGAKSLKDAFSDMIKSITRSIADLAAKGLASNLFGQGGPLSGIGGLLSKIFGGGGAGVNTGAAAGAASAADAAAKAAEATITAATQSGTAAATMLTAGTTLTSAGAALTASATALSTAASSLAAGGGGGGGGFGELIGGLLGGGGEGSLELGGFASGTDYAPGGLALVGERGPELINLPRGAQVIPNEVLQQRREQKIFNITVNTHVHPGATTQSARQAAAMVREAVSRSARDR